MTTNTRGKRRAGAPKGPVDLSDLPTREDVERLRAECRRGSGPKDAAAREAGQKAEQVYARMDAIMTRAEDAGRELLASEARDFDRCESVYDELTEIHNTNTVDRRGVVAPAEPEAYQPGTPLASGQSFRAAISALGAHDGAGGEDESLSLQKYLRGAMLGHWDGAESERQVFAALSGTSSDVGGILVPSILSTEIVDKARAQTRVIQAGARIVPMQNRKVTVPKWVTDPVPDWRGENDPFAEDDATMGAVELSAKSLGVTTRVSIELLEDSDIQGELEAALAKSFALVVDRDALYADGTGDKPTGVKSTPGINVQALATNGAAPTWDALVESVGRLRDRNEEPTGQIMSDRTLRSLSLLKETGTGAYVAPPTYLDGITRHTTGQVPNTLTTGTSTENTSDVFTADWSNLLIGVRSELRIFILKERFLPDAGHIGFVALWRGDFAASRPTAFDVVTGVKA